MRAVTSGVSTGGTVALVLKLLNWADKQPTQIPPFEPLPWQLDGPSFAAGICVGLLAYAFVEFCLTLKWALIAWVSYHVVLILHLLLDLCTRYFDECGLPATGSGRASRGGGFAPG